MRKNLSEMSLEELWELFPIFLVEHSSEWNADYAEMERALRDALRACGIVRISHIGSTAIEGIRAKNIVDILLEIESDGDLERAAKAAEKIGFIRMSTEAERISLNLGYTPEGFADKVYHLHLRHAGDNDELYFRDYLNAHPQAAKAYERLKLELAEKYRNNRNAYTDAKTAFIRKWTREARMLYGKRYE